MCVDTTLPAAVIDDPPPGSILPPEAEIKGEADDANFDSAVLEFRTAADGETPPGEWTKITDIAEPVRRNLDGSPAILGTWTPPEAEGNYELRLTVTDRAGNVAETIVAVNVDHI